MMEERFYSNLASIFRVLLHQPSSIVDDTAVERLLLMLQKYSQSHNDDVFIRSCIAFWENDALWENGVSASFALRLSTCMVCQQNISTELRNSIHLLYKKCIEKTDKFAIVPIKHGFYEGLNVIFSEKPFPGEWFLFVEENMDVIWEDMSTTSTFIRKTIISFMANFLNHSLQEDKAQSLFDLISTTKVITVIDSFINCLTLLIELNITSFINVVTKTIILQKALELCLREDGNVENVPRTFKLSIVHLLTSIKNRRDHVTWKEILQTKEKPHIYLKRILDGLSNKQDGTLSMFCLSLLQNNTSKASEHCFPDDWNITILKLMTSSVMQPNISDVKKWKIDLLTVIDMSSKIGNELYEDENCAALLNQWCSFLLKLLRCSTNNMADVQLERHHVSMINNHKLSRMVFLYLKELDIHYLCEEVRAMFVRVLLDIILGTDLQFQWASLDNIRKQIQNGHHLHVIKTVCARDYQMEFGDILYMKLQNENWEIKDSVLALYDVLIHNVKSKGCEVSKNILSNNRCWCKELLALLDNEESFVRSKSCLLIQNVVLTDDVKKIFLQENELQNEGEVWERIKTIFLDPYRADDMFTRRSVLKLLSAWVRYDVFDQSNVADSTTILTNAALDFDWEIRYACLDVVLTIIKQDETGLLDFVFEIFNDVIMLGLKDAEYKVRTKTLECLKEFQIQLLATQQHNSNILMELPLYNESGFEILTIDALRHFVTSYNFHKALDDVTEMDENVKDDCVSFMQDILYSAKKADDNLLIDCY
eukprot:TCONS_00057518-protein